MDLVAFVRNIFIPPPKFKNENNNINLTKGTPEPVSNKVDPSIRILCRLRPLDQTRINNKNYETNHTPCKNKSFRYTTLGAMCFVFSNATLHFVLTIL
jgi:hypothetical protein